MLLRERRRWGAGLTVALFIVGLLVIAPADANPAVPSCGPASAAAGAGSATADQYDPALCVALSGRVFPEAFPQDVYFQPDASGHSNQMTATDYVSYYEFQQGLHYLADLYPDYIEIHEVANSAGNDGASSPVYLLEITNELSPVPLEERQALLFMLSIHGNEKGGREGGFRVLEDLLRGIGVASETIQDGAGMSPAIPRPGGEGPVTTYHDYLDFQRIFLLFPNTDGWTCDELEAIQGTDACPGTFRRTNGEGRDLNRQAPTIGWHRQAENRDVVGQPEAIGYYTWMRENVEDWTYAIDIHGMTGHENFGAIMLPAGGMTPLEMEKSLSLAETLKERLNDDPHFSEWLTLMSVGETVASASGTGVNPTGAVGSTQFAEYYTVIDAIGYTDSGFNGDYFAQDTGLNAPGYDIELAWNHGIAGAQYEAGALWNDYHVKMTREIVKSFMDAAALDVQVSFDTGGKRTLYVESGYVATNLDDASTEVPADSWAATNPGDDLWQYSAENPFIARPAKYWSDLKSFVRDGEEPGVLTGTPASRLTAESLATYDTLVIAGSAINGFLLSGTAPENGLKVDDEGNLGIVDEGKINMVLAWVENGGTLLLTDSALEFFDLAGLTTDGVEVMPRYMGGIKVANYFGHEYLEDVRGGVMQMYEPTPLGFGVTGSAPNWYLTESAATSLGVNVAGRECGMTQLNTPACDGNGIGLGYATIGAGRIGFMGSLLPDPTEEFYHPYGLDNYATTYSGNLIMLNMLGFDKIYSAPPVVITEAGQILQTANEPASTDSVSGVAQAGGNGKSTPGIGLVVLAGALVAAFMMRRKD